MNAGISKGAIYHHFESKEVILIVYAVELIMLIV
ncbi:MAG: TetR family transcriptional regulator [Ruminiclostridium sp.]